METSRATSNSPIVKKKDEAVRNLNTLSIVMNSNIRHDWTKQWLMKHVKLDPKIGPKFKNSNNDKTDEQNNDKSKFDLYLIDNIYYFNKHFQMTEKQFRFLVDKLTPLIANKEPKRKKKNFTVEEKLAITLKYLATGELHTCRHYSFRASQSVILNMIGDICLKIYEVLKEHYLKLPMTQDEWIKISEEFYNRYKTPNYLGDLCCRRFLFQTIRKATKHYLYRRGEILDHSMILIAIIDSNLNFLYVEIGDKTDFRDTDVFSKTKLKKYFENNLLNLPKDNALPNTGKLFPYYFSADPTFPTGSHIFRRLGYFGTETEEHGVKYAFDILANMFEVLMHPFRIDCENAKKITYGCFALYNFLRKDKQHTSAANTNSSPDNQDKENDITNTNDTIIDNNNMKNECDNGNLIKKNKDDSIWSNDDLLDEDDNDCDFLLEGSDALVKITNYNFHKNENSEHLRSYLVDYLVKEERSARMNK